MICKYKETQPQLYQYIKKIINNNKINHAYIIETNGLSYGFDIAMSLSKTFLCPNNYLDNVICSSCTLCSNIDKGNYPDLKIIEADGKNIKKEQLIDLQQAFKVKNLYGRYLIYIIKDANLLNKSAANTILKFLEEPNDNIIAILLTDNIYNCIDTIVSRCQILSLKSNLNKISDNYYKKYSDDDNLDNFINNFNKNAISFYLFLEKYKTEMIAYYDFSYIKDKIELLLIVGLHLYKDALNFKVQNVVINFNKYTEEIKNISLNNDTSDIINKIELINKFLQFNNYNINKDLFLDNFIINFCGGI